MDYPVRDKTTPRMRDKMRQQNLNTSNLIRTLLLTLHRLISQKSTQEAGEGF